MSCPLDVCFIFDNGRGIRFFQASTVNDWADMEALITEHAGTNYRCAEIGLEGYDFIFGGEDVVSVELTFADTNWASVHSPVAMVSSVTAHAPAPWDEAINTAVNHLQATDYPSGKGSDFTPPFRETAQKVILLFATSGPGGINAEHAPNSDHSPYTTGATTAGTDEHRAMHYAYQAASAGVSIGIVYGTYNADATYPDDDQADDTRRILAAIAEVTDGYYLELSASYDLQAAMVECLGHILCPCPCPAVREIDPAMQARLELDQLTQAIIIKIVRQDGVTLGFTTLDTDLTVDGQLYTAMGGIASTVMRESLSAEADNAEISGALTLDGISEDDLIGERYDYANIQTWIVDWMYPEIPPIKFKSGSIGKVSIEAGKYSCEFKGLGLKPEQQIIRLTSALCSAAKLGSAPCNADLTGKVFDATGDATLVGAESLALVGTGVAIQADGFFDYGLLEALTGPNAGIQREIKSGSTLPGILFVDLAEAFPWTPTDADTYRLTAGCDRTFGVCHNQFGNAVNFQGFPHLAGTSLMMQQGQHA